MLYCVDFPRVGLSDAAYKETAIESKYLGYIRNRIFIETRGILPEKYVARCAGQSGITGNCHDDDSLNPASIEAIGLHNQHGTPEPRL